VLVEVYYIHQISCTLYLFLQFTPVQVGSILHHPGNIFALPHTATASECPCKRNKAANYVYTNFPEGRLTTTEYTANIMEAVITLTEVMNLFSN
jgi:hypothetical protein